MRGDLHIHTTASDGKLKPSEVVEEALKIGLSVISITDHESVDGIEEAINKARGRIEVVHGVEISVDIPGNEVHILGYFIDHRSEFLKRRLKELREGRERRAREMLARLRKLGIELSWERVLELADGGSIGRPHVARAMKEMGYISSIEEAFTKYIGRNGPAYVEREKLSPEEAGEIIRRAGGIPFIAHPAELPDDVLKEIIERLKKGGELGMEVYYNGYPQDVVERLLFIAKREGLYISGGSDFHGFDEGPKLGETGIPEECLKDFLRLKR